MNTLDVGPFLEQLTEPLNFRTMVLLLWYLVIYAGAKRAVGWGWAGLKGTVGLLGAKDISDPLTLRILSETGQAALGEHDGSLETQGGLTLRLDSTKTDCWVLCAGVRLDQHIPTSHRKAVLRAAVSKLRTLNADRDKQKRDEWVALLTPKGAA